MCCACGVHVLGWSILYCCTSSCSLPGGTSAHEVSTRVGERMTCSSVVCVCARALAIGSLRSGVCQHLSRHVCSVSPPCRAPDNTTWLCVFCVVCVVSSWVESTEVKLASLLPTGVVQTAYANGGASEFLQQKLVITASSHAHPVDPAATQDVSCYALSLSLSLPL